MRIRTLVLAAAFASLSSAAHADTLASNYGHFGTNAAGFWGESFNSYVISQRDDGARYFDNLVFSFLGGNRSYTSFAIGTGYLLNQAYSGAPGDLSSATPGFLGKAKASNGRYTFDPSVVLGPANVYYFYVGTRIPAGTINTDIGYNFGSAWYSPTRSGNLQQNSASAVDFTFTGDPLVTPEPSSIALLSTGLLGLLLLGNARMARGRQSSPANHIATIA